MTVDNFVNVRALAFMRFSVVFLLDRLLQKQMESLRDLQVVEKVGRGDRI